jgi:hypothetical protein
VDESEIGVETCGCGCSRLVGRVGLEWRPTRTKRDSQPYESQWAYLDRGPIPSALKLRDVTRRPAYRESLR